MTARVGHRTKTELEAAVCAEMTRQRLSHEHRSLRFRVREETGGTPDYAPAIVARRGPILFLVEPIADARATEAIGQLTRFLEQHSTDIVLVVVTPDEAYRTIPLEAYDEIYPASDVRRLTTRIRQQDLKGIVRPFEKPRPAG
ncbi:MAG: hypothetical protein ACREDF_06195 [Thermoplasmata archaeon]